MNSWDLPISVPPLLLEPVPSGPSNQERDPWQQSRRLSFCSDSRPKILDSRKAFWSLRRKISKRRTSSLEVPRKIGLHAMVLQHSFNAISRVDWSRLVLRVPPSSSLGSLQSRFQYPLTFWIQDFLTTAYRSTDRFNSRRMSMSFEWLNLEESIVGLAQEGCKLFVLKIQRRLLGRIWFGRLILNW